MACTNLEIDPDSLAPIAVKILQASNDIVHCAARATNGSSLQRIMHKEFVLAD